MTRKIPTFLILLFSVFLYTAEVNAQDSGNPTPPSQSDGTGDATYDTICKIIGYVWTIGGPLMTVVIIGAALLGSVNKVLE